MGCLALKFHKQVLEVKAWVRAMCSSTRCPQYLELTSRCLEILHHLRGQLHLHNPRGSANKLSTTDFEFCPHSYCSTAFSPGVDLTNLKAGQVLNTRVLSGLQHYTEASEARISSGSSSSSNDDSEARSSRADAHHLC